MLTSKINHKCIDHKNNSVDPQIYNSVCVDRTIL